VAGDVPVYLASSAEKLRMARADFDWAARPSGAWIATVPITGYLLAYGCSAWWRLWRRRARIAEEQEEGRPHPLRGIGLFTTLVVVIGAVSGVLDFTPWVKEGNSITAFAAVLGIFALLWSVTQPTKLIVVPRASVPRAELSETAGLPMGALPPAEGPAPRPEPGAASAAAAAVEPAVAIAAANASVAGDLSASEASSVLSAAELALLSGRLRRLLEEDRIHLDPDLSLHVLAERSKTTRHKMSVVLKQGFGGSFYQVISGYRVREAARTLRSKQGAVRTIADIAFASGFNSLSAFNVAFRAYFSQTPSVFRDDASEKTTVSLSRK
jgi:AraC-like DNA-binding protein